MALMQEEEEEEEGTRRERPCEGRGWSDAVTAEEPWEPPAVGRDRKDPPQSLQQESFTWISDFRPLARRQNEFLLF